MAVYEKQVRLPADVLEELGDHSGRWWSDPALEPIIVEAIRAYIKPAPAKRQPPTDSETAGYRSHACSAAMRRQPSALHHHIRRRRAVQSALENPNPSRRKGPPLHPAWRRLSIVMATSVSMVRREVLDASTGHTFPEIREEKKPASVCLPVLFSKAARPPSWPRSIHRQAA